MVARIFYMLAAIGAAAGGAQFFTTYLMHLGADMSAPQLAALAAECLVYAVIPYCFARALDLALRKREG